MKLNHVNSSILWVITRRKVVKTDVSGLPVRYIFKTQAVQEEGRGSKAR